MLRNIENGQFLVPFRLAEHASAIAALVAKYSDVPMDLADACLVAMASEFATGAILTLDSDFLICRWAGGQPFEPLIALEPR